MTLRRRVGAPLRGLLGVRASLRLLTGLGVRVPLRLTRLRVRVPLRLLTGLRIRISLWLLTRLRVRTSLRGPAGLRGIRISL